jgi:branched-chain amino acid transport system substrate-binding protein
MTITRRDVLLGATATAALMPLAARAQTSDVVIGVIYPFSGASAQQGVDAQKAYETALEVINKDSDFDLPLPRARACRVLAARKSSSSSPTTRPIRRRAAPRPSA